MSERIFQYANGFNKDEAWGNWREVNGLLFLLLTAIRSEIKKLDPSAYLVIHNAYESAGHNPKGEHPKGNATDFHVVTEIPYHELIGHLETILRDLQVFDRVGLGIYPTWNKQGFHLDVRGIKARWGRIGKDYVNYEIARQYALNLEVNGDDPKQP